MDFQDLASRLGIAKEDFIELVELFVSVSLSDIDKIKKGLQANNCQDVSAASHSIKGASANLGFDDIAQLSSDMEIQAKGGSVENFETYISDLEKMLSTLTDL